MASIAQQLAVLATISSIALFEGGYCNEFVSKCNVAF